MAEQKQQGKNVPVGQSMQREGQGQPRGQGQPQGGRAMQPSRQQGLGGYGGGRGQMLSPFSFVRRMMDDMDRLFGDFGGSSLPSLFDEDFFGGRSGGELAQAQAWSPQIEVFEQNGSFIVRADLPGIDPKDVKVDIDDDMLTIQGERRAEHEEKREGYFHSERSYGSFTRRIPLPRGADRSSCDAVFENGVLEIKMKMPEKASRNVQIRGGAGGKTAQQQSSSQSQPSAKEQAPVSHNGPAAGR